MQNTRRADRQPSLQHVGSRCRIQNPASRTAMQQLQEVETALGSGGREYGEPVIADLRRCGLLREDDKILCRKAMKLRYANIIFDLERAEALKIVHGYLDELGIAYCGRYGDWGYMWTDESFISGEKAAERVLTAAACRS